MIFSGMEVFSIVSVCVVLLFNEMNKNANHKKRIERLNKRVGELEISLIREERESVKLRKRISTWDFTKEIAEDDRYKFFEELNNLALVEDPSNEDVDRYLAICSYIGGTSFAHPDIICPLDE